MMQSASLFTTIASASFSITCKLSAGRRLTFTKPPCPLLRVLDLPCIRCVAAGEVPVIRRNAQYQLNLWSNDYIQSLSASNYSADEEEQQTRRRNVLKEKTRERLHEEKELEQQLQLIDHLQQLGVAYHFKSDIRAALEGVHGSLEEISLLLKDNLHATALLFRLLRENGFSVSEAIFSRFTDEKGNFKSCLGDQTKGILSLYQASYLEEEGEELLHNAVEFTTKHLKILIDGASLEPQLINDVIYALELPLNWRMQRLHSRRFIESSQRKKNINPELLELARLDFNLIQSAHRRELQQLSSWWTNLGLAKKLPFFRDRLAENYLWTVGWTFDPEESTARAIQTKANCFITMIDDVYDVYGTLDELQLFTDAIDKWDVNAIGNLPDYMKLCFMAMFNTTNDASYEIRKEKDLDILPYLKRAWADLCESYLVEAKWCHRGYTPKLSEYLDNAWISISGHVVLAHAYSMSKYSTKEALGSSFSNYPQTLRSSCTLFRMHDDLGTSKAEIQRGDVPKCVQCCMHERDVSEMAARQQIKEMIRDTWRALNRERRTYASSLEEHFNYVAVNMVRTAQMFYQHGDGYAEADGWTRDYVMSIIIEPIKQ